MDLKKILIGGITGGILLFVAFLVFSTIANLIDPDYIGKIGDMRAMKDPFMLLFFAYPFVLSFTSAIAFDRVKGALNGSCCGGAGLTFGRVLILLITIPSMFVIFTSMTYPPGFYIENLLFGIIGFPALGMLYARIWGV
jgi:hypothetical protein